MLNASASASPSGYRVRLPATRAEAEAIPFAEDAFPDRERPPTLLTDEPDPSRPDDWTLDAYFADTPSDDDIARLYALVPSAPPGSATVEPIADTDWVTLSQSGFPPVRAGRFVVHTAAHADAVRASDIGIAIEAGLAFGTGQHFTTHGCLAALDALAKTHRFTRAADLGTGTGVLAIAIAKRWPRATVVASDIDPVATIVARANLAANGVRQARGRGAIDLVTAPGVEHPRLRGRFNLVTANILAGPLVAMAGPVAATLAPGGILVLAGLLTTQARRVAAAYTARGFRLVDRLDRSEWPTLVLERG
ncbi:50S ribosomal protein L11 methyltransferase [Polymorphobacter sp. PAMC 29334]|uniref:50S ribosomal protein L11 methyltransferase n=1 Tax=Polymorphobacter sp. PAMC 29334 TaxID=2862331 RepID=UPI001C766990|nr:50S ribosomal protein L11 methyltransferase [Polymorphobacter sp. PAMC 29334]QYE34504.1 50S ribosomal protein L11 methyltransferase [Polymorphobacter sp. PAMC 29334]